jgi:hypothetical protein
LKCEDAQREKGLGFALSTTIFLATFAIGVTACTCPPLPPAGINTACAREGNKNKQNRNRIRIFLKGIRKIVQSH